MTIYVAFGRAVARGSAVLVAALAAAIHCPLVANTHGQLEVSLIAAEELVVDGVNDLNFGGVLIDSGIHQVDKEDAGAGLFTITGSSNRRVLVTLSPPAALTNGNGDEIPYTSQAAYRNDGAANNDPAGATEFNGNSETFHITTGAGVPQQDTAYVWIYGQIEVDATVPAGTYTAVFTLTADYVTGGGGGL